MEFTQETGRIYSLHERGPVLAEITFPLVEPGTVDINRTYVAPILRGQGIAGQLLAAAAQQIRARGLKTRTSCPYAAKWFAAHPEEADLLAPEP